MDTKEFCEQHDFFRHVLHILVIFLVLAAIAVGIFIPTNQEKAEQSHQGSGAPTSTTNAGTP